MNTIERHRPASLLPANEMQTSRENEQPRTDGRTGRHKCDQPPDLYQVVIECRDESQQRELFERLRQEGMKVRLLVL